MKKILPVSQNSNLFSYSLLGPFEPHPEGLAPTLTAFCHRRLEPITPAGCAACFARDARAQIAYGCRQHCDAANTTPTPPSLGSEQNTSRVACETVERALTLDSFAPIERLIREYCYTGPDVVRALGREGHRAWVRAVVELCREEVGV